MGWRPREPEIKRTRARGTGRSRRAPPGTAWAILLILVACGLAGALSAQRVDRVMLEGYGASGEPSRLTSPQANLAAARSASGRFRIAGSIRGLYPGDSARLVLKVINTHPFAIVVTSIRTTVRRPTAKCAASNLTVHRFSGHLRVPARRLVTLSVPVRLSHGAPNACQGVVFPLAYSGLAARQPSRGHARRRHRRVHKRNRTS